MNFYRFSWVYLEGDVTWRWARVFGNHFRGQERDVELGMMCGRYWFGSVLSIRGMFGEIEVSIFMSEIFDSSRLWGFLFCFWALCTHELTLSIFHLATVLWPIRSPLLLTFYIHYQSSSSLTLSSTSSPTGPPRPDLQKQKLETE
jgi:hypothetical protein